MRLGLGSAGDEGQQHVKQHGQQLQCKEHITALPSPLLVLRRSPSPAPRHPATAAQCCAWSQLAVLHSGSIIALHTNVHSTG
jgi:hypothetical protein